MRSAPSAKLPTISASQKHVLRFWEAKFAQIRPMKRGGGRRYYRPEDLELLKGVQQLLHRDGYTIKGVQKILREQGVDAVKLRNLPSSAQPGDMTSTAPVNAASGPLVADATKAATVSTQGGRRRATAAVAASTQPQPRRAAVIATAIAELEACRVLLSTATGTGSIAAGTKRHGAPGIGR